MRRIKFTLRRVRLTEHQRWLIEMGHLWADAHDHQPPRVKDWKRVTMKNNRTAWPSYQTAVRAFGTWDNFIKACGWEPRGRGRPSKPDDQYAHTDHRAKRRTEQVKSPLSPFTRA